MASRRPSLLGGTRFGQVRATDLGEHEQTIFKVAKNVAFIDMHGVQSFIGHAYYLINPSASSDIIFLRFGVPVSLDHQHGTNDRVDRFFV